MTTVLNPPKIGAEERFVLHNVASSAGPGCDAVNR